MFSCISWNMVCIFSCSASKNVLDSACSSRVLYTSFCTIRNPLPKSKAEVIQLCRRRSIHLRTTGVERNKGIYNGPFNRCAILFRLSNGISPSWSNRMSVEIVSFLSVSIEIVLYAHNCDVSCFSLFSRRMRMADRMSGLSGTVISSLFEGRKDERYFQSVPASISRLRSFSKYSSVLLHSFSCCL